MPDRSDPPEYDWLYGKRRAQEPAPAPASQSASQSASEPEATRVMPRTQRQDAARPPAPASAAPAGPRRRRRFPYGKVVLLVLVAWIAYLVLVPVLAWKRIDQVDAFPSGSRPASQPG